MGDNDERNIIVVYLKKDLSFEKLIPNMRNYITQKYKCSLKERMDLVANVKNLFDQVYKNGQTIYSGIHGEKETDILSASLEDYTIKTAQVNKEETGAILVISENDMEKVSKTTEEELVIKKMFNDIEDFLRKRFNKG